MSKPSHDRFDDVPHATGRVGAHRAEAPGMNGWVVLLWSAAAVLVLVVLGIFGSLLAMGRISFGGDTPPSQVATAAPEETGVVDTSYAVLILNATSDGSLDGQVRDQLIKAGWDGTSISSSDASTSDFPTTTVYYVEDADEAAAIGLAGAIGGAEVQKSDVYKDLNDSGGKQLTVVIGTDRSTKAPETPAE
ncbi:LytR C-terminal domain-containing protein [Microbacterium sp. KUDC0406]|uniref:LytR C-terminal domain-containing protein n=1 Tax=Microbacterium sp. KUDC0406 TaxID=2909588 RepID=UPI001F3D6C49|nr:LytR C-terminal domain-containing protein [Microbacterium sp. KUDC0406]UJP10447.1 LytR C-terminal domain-containing protein [Microbacterium sp. KUDC0406]